MKKTAVIILCTLLLIFASGCNNKQYRDGSYIILPMETTDKAVNEQIIDDFLMENIKNFSVIKKNVPHILSHLVDITPSAIEDKCSIYRFSYESATAVAGSTLLIYDNAVYVLGSSLGGYGITEFAYFENAEQSVLYYIYSSGSGIHRSEIGAFDFKTKLQSSYGGLIEDFVQQDIAFTLSGNGKKLGICKADIEWTDFDKIEVKVTKGEKIFNDINKFEFEAIENR